MGINTNSEMQEKASEVTKKPLAASNNVSNLSYIKANGHIKGKLYTLLFTFI
jgi:hypothetical protein